MSRIEEMLKEMCPDGVEYRRLGDVTAMKRGTSLTKKKAEEGSIPVISGGRLPAFYCNQSNREGETITVAGSGAGAGFVQYWNEPIFACDCFTVKGTEALDTRYVYHWMTSMQDAIYSCKKGGGVPHVHISDIDSFEIPVPPLAVQREVVRVLDTMTELTTELTTKLNAELTARTKQYTYYREELLKLEGVEGVEYRKIEDVCTIRNGYTPSKKHLEYWENGTVPWFRMDDIRTRGRVLSDSLQHVTPQAVKGQLFQADSLIFATTATIGEHAIISVPFLCNQRFTVLTIRDEMKEAIEPRYLFHYGFIIDEWCKRNTKSGTMAAVDMSKFRKIEIPVPPLPVQQDIVTKLDAFSSYCTDLTSGLPAEIEARNKLYAYYRDRMLTFPMRKK